MRSESPLETPQNNRMEVKDKNSSSHRKSSVGKGDEGGGMEDDGEGVSGTVQRATLADGGLLRWVGGRKIIRLSITRIDFAQKKFLP